METDCNAKWSDESVSAPVHTCALDKGHDGAVPMLAVQRDAHRHGRCQEGGHMRATDVERVRTLSRQYKDRAASYRLVADKAKTPEHEKQFRDAEHEDTNMAQALDAVLERALLAPEQ